MEDGRRARGAATRQRIVEASVSLIATKGLAGVSGATLSQAADVSKATVFHHFPSIDEVPLAALDFIIDGLVAAVEHHDDARAFLLQAGRDVLWLTAEGADEALTMNALFTGASQNPGSPSAWRRCRRPIAIEWDSSSPPLRRAPTLRELEKWPTSPSPRSTVWPPI